MYLRLNGFYHVVVAVGTPEAKTNAGKKAGSGSLPSDHHNASGRTGLSVLTLTKLKHRSKYDNRVTNGTGLH